MLGPVAQVFGNLVAGICLSSVSLLFFGAAILLKLLPQSLRTMRLGLRGFLILSFRFYRFLFTHLAQAVQQHFKLDILDNPARTVASLLVSLALGSLALLAGGIRFTALSVGLCLLHGVAVSLAWEETEQPEGIRMGARIQ